MKNNTENRKKKKHNEFIRYIFVIYMIEKKHERKKKFI